ncbi:MAG: hypothetical protein KDD60_04510 [Bdellovibrionales bacterium]|nr:hypothetical protein [Bdellovibrionales bacterium]
MTPHRNTVCLALPSLAVSLLTVFGMSQSAMGEQSTTLFFPNVRESVRVAGIVYGPEQTFETSAHARYDELRNGMFITVDIPNSLSLNSTLVSGVVETPNSELLFGPLTFGDLPDPRAVVPICEAADSASKIQPEQAQLLRSLVEIRQRRVQVIQKTIKEMAVPALVERLTRLESQFGFQYKEPFSAELSATEIAARLDALYHAITRYKFYKGQRERLETRPSE